MPGTEPTLPSESPPAICTQKDPASWLTQNLCRSSRSPTKPLDKTLENLSKQKEAEEEDCNTLLQHCCGRWRKL
jgi:hypothetical protein